MKLPLGSLDPKLVAPVVVVLLALLVTAGMIATRPDAESNRPRVLAPLVRVIRVQPEAVRLTVLAQGSVEPRTESDLVTEVSGRIVWVSPQMASGGFFEQGDVLARIEPRDYEVALEGARAALARARSNEVHSSASLQRQKSMRQTGASSRARLDDAIHAQAAAEAGVREARVAVTRAELDLERTEIRAPFAGRVRAKHVDVGQFVGRGAPVARIYSVDYAEVRLPLSDADLAFLDLPLGFRERSDPAPASAEADGDAPPAAPQDPALVASDPTPGPGAPDAALPERDGPRVVLRARFAGREHTWHGRIVRTEGALDARSRMLNVVARVDDPYARGDDPDRPPLPIGLFVDASIEGRTVDGVFEIPRTALRRQDEVLVVDADERLRVRRVDVLRSDREHSWIRSGLEAGDRVVVTSLEVATDGMKVRSREAPAS